MNPNQKMKNALLTLLFSLIFIVIFGIIVVQLDIFNLYDDPLDFINITEVDPCTCGYKNKEIFSMCYRHPVTGERGKPFPCELQERLEHLGLLEDNDGSKSESWNSSYVIVTAFSASHFEEGQRLIQSIQDTHPGKKIIVYDIGMKRRSAEKVRKWCNVEYIMFPFASYPKSFRRLTQYRWKSIVIAETLRKYENFIYADSSVIFKNASIMHSLKSKLFCRIRSGGYCRKSQMLLYSYTGHEIATATDPDLYEYFPSQIDKLNEKMYESGLIAIQKSPQTQEIVKWLVLCSLDDQCMSTSLFPNVCNSDRISNYKLSKHAQGAPVDICHRFDQSVINVLLANSFDYDHRNYIGHGDTLSSFKIKRYFDEIIKNHLTCAGSFGAIDTEEDESDTIDYDERGHVQR